MAKDAKTRAKARALYEAGESFAQIAPKVKASVRILKDWCKNEGWVKGESAPKLHQKAEKALEAEAERHGVTKGRVFEKVAELMEAKKTEFYKGVPVCDVTDNGTRLGATSLAADLLGMKKVEVEPGEEFRQFFQSLRAPA